MESRRYVAPSLIALSSLGCAGLIALAASAGCGGTNGPGTFQAAGEDAGSLGSPTDASIFPEDVGSLLNDANQPPCPPAPVTSFTPSWKPPIASKSGACTTVQISTFFDACMGPSSTASGCTAYVQANTSCAACLQSNDTDPQYGPVIWHANRLYYTTNIAGCIADEQGDGGAGGCGAAYQAVVQCKETACSACLSPQNPDFTRYSACEGQAEGECSSFTQTLTTACGNAFQDPTNPIAICIPPSGDTAQDAYLQLAPIFCGQ
jgi:hypothetical protein